MTKKFSLSSAGNTLAPAYLALLHKGYDVQFSRDEDREWWHAENEAGYFSAEDPLTLLGLIALYETRGEEWQASDEQVEGFMERFG